MGQSIFSRKLLELRNQKELSQSKLAQKVGVSKQSVKAWETGDSFPTGKNLEKLSRFFNVSIDSLTKDENDNSSISLKGLNDENKSLAKDYVEFLRKRQGLYK